MGACFYDSLSDSTSVDLAATSVPPVQLGQADRWLTCCDRQFQQAAEGGSIGLFGLGGRTDRQFQQAAEGGPIGLFGLESRPDRQFQQAAEGGPIWLFGLEGRTDRQFQQATEGGPIGLFGLEGRADRQFQQATEGGPIGLLGLEGRTDLHAPRLDIGSGFMPIGTAMVSSAGLIGSSRRLWVPIWLTIVGPGVRGRRGADRAMGMGRVPMSIHSLVATQRKRVVIIRLGLRTC
jgi:hypothetical protein